ncbi:hypothetical protein DFH09DRAFT_1466594 [Mycena vulgaris]|nr:hypothetical protein DFH09DRAFT_1466594 [Mycena vulgaris]
MCERAEVRVAWGGDKQAAEGERKGAEGQDSELEGACQHRATCPSRNAVLNRRFSRPGSGSRDTVGTQNAKIQISFVQFAILEAVANPKRDYPFVRHIEFQRLRDEMFAPTIYNKAPYTAYILSVGDHALVITAMDTIAVDPTDYASLPVLSEIEELKKFIESDSQIVVTIINKWLQRSPVYFEIDNSPTLVLTHVMNTHAGFSAFLNKKLNGYLKRLFDRWGIYLTTPASANVLTAGKGGGFSKLTLAGMMEHFTGLTFEQVFVSYPAAPHYGFTCWNDLFTRKLRSGIRPVEHRESPDIISAACESQYYNVATNMKERDTFWLNGQSYSLRDMLAHDELYQGYLRVTYYHRWHTPAAGVVKKIVAVPGAYFCQSPAMLQSPIPLDAPFDTLPISNSLSFLPYMVMLWACMGAGRRNLWGGVPQLWTLEEAVSVAVDGMPPADVASSASPLPDEETLPPADVDPSEVHGESSADNAVYDHARVDSEDALLLTVGEEEQSDRRPRAQAQARSEKPEEPEVTLEIPPHVLVEERRPPCPSSPMCHPGVTLTMQACFLASLCLPRKSNIYSTFNFGNTSMQFIADDNQSISRLDFYNSGTTCWNSGNEGKRRGGGDEASIKHEELRRRQALDGRGREIYEERSKQNTPCRPASSNPPAPLYRGTQIRSACSCQAPAACAASASAPACAPARAQSLGSSTPRGAGASRSQEPGKDTRTRDAGRGRRAHASTQRRRWMWGDLDEKEGVSMWRTMREAKKTEKWARTQQGKGAEGRRMEYQGGAAQSVELVPAVATERDKEVTTRRSFTPLVSHHLVLLANCWHC